MERTKLLTVAVIGLLLLNLLTIGYLVLRPDERRGPGQNGPPGGGEPSTVIIERLQFDSLQQQQYAQLINAHQKQTRALSRQSVELFRAYYGLLEAVQPDTAQANSLSQQIAQNQRNQARLNFAHFEEIKRLCRPDQQAAFNQLVSELSRLFGRQQRPARSGRGRPPGDRPEGPPSPDIGGPPEDRLEGPPENAPHRP